MIVNSSNRTVKKISAMFKDRNVTFPTCLKKKHVNGFPPLLYFRDSVRLDFNLERISFEDISFIHDSRCENNHRVEEVS